MMLLDEYYLKLAANGRALSPANRRDWLDIANLAPGHKSLLIKFTPKLRKMLNAIAKGRRASALD